MHHEGGKCEYVWNTWMLRGSLEALQQLRKFMDKKTELAFSVGEKLGIFRENYAFMNEYDDRVTAAGGERTTTFEGRRTIRKSQPLGGKS